MLKKTERLTKKQFDDFFASGKRKHFPHCTIIYTPHNTFHGAVVVGKKVAKRAVVRNTLRRRVYAQLYTTRTKHNLTGVFIIILKPTFATLSRKAAHTMMAENIATVIKNA